MTEETSNVQNYQWNRFVQNVYLTATIQGRFAYFLMSIHAVNPWIFARYTSTDPTDVLFYNMVYGMAVHLYSRPSMLLINHVHRAMFSAMGSLMFNYSVLMGYDILIDILKGRPALLTVAGYLVGRFFIVNLLAFLYHVDSRSLRTYRRNTAYEQMYS